MSVVVAPARPPVPSSGAGSPVRSARRRVLAAAAAALVAAAVVVLLRLTGVLEGPVAVVVGALLVLVVPTSRSVSRRVVLAGPVLLGWLPCLWWLPWGGGVGRVTVMLAVGSAGLAARTAGAARPARALRELLPDLRLVDLLPAGAAGAAALLAQPWLTVRAPGAALGMMSAGWDHSAHYDMVSMIRHHGAVVGHLAGPPDGGRWAYDTYPQGFHAAAAALVELVDGPVVATPAAELVTYAHVLGLLSVAVAALVVAAVCAVPGAARRPAVVLPLAALAAATLLLGPGGRVVTDGFPNLLVAVGLAACVPTLVLCAARVHVPVLLVALGGAVVGVAQSWALLLVLCAGALPALVVPARRARWAARPTGWVATGAVALATLVGVGHALVTLAGTDLDAVLVIDGAGSTVPSAHALPLLLGAVAVGVGVLGEARRTRSVGLLRAGLLVGVPLAGLGFAAWVGWLQIRSGGALTYYFWKQLVGLVVVAAVVLAVVVTARASRGAARPVGAAGWTVALLVAAGATQVFGATLPAVQSAGFGALAPGAATRGNLTEAGIAALPSADVVLGAARAAAGEDGHRPVLVVPYPVETGLHPFASAQWTSALTGTWTGAASALPGLLVDTDPVRVATAALASDPTVLVVVHPDVLADVRDAVDRPEQVIAWSR
ncbi:hypothetical protein GXP71_09655 [Cellulomonas sp. H30R-01]|uniref:hypothetical protein n=1 Tax=Cellulomonas sp. H30R-01 TaxID=2704467 RepID=UPI00138D737A|nr:hypothetical protein [Cellulomonas sp. H30R-01]QHT56315.1 hypothetical protein GXP71_09655 [Cellulomonas sp. H30R-01]